MAQNIDDLSLEEVMAHFGTKGMKWGIRGGKGTTGVTRSRGAILDRNARAQKINSDALSGKKYKAQVFIGKKLLGEKRYINRLNKINANLSAQDTRLISGKLKIRDRLQLIGNVGSGELLVSIRPK